MALLARYEAKKMQTKTATQFPFNVTQWLSKVEDVVQQNEDAIGRRWDINCSFFYAKFSLSDMEFSSGFDYLQRVDFVGDTKIYPFNSFKNLLEEKAETLTVDQIDTMMQHWAEMLFFVITGNQEIHPWFNTTSLHTFCTLAASSLPKHFQVYEELYLVAKAYRELGNEKANDDFYYSSMRHRVPASSSETKAAKPSLDVGVYFIFANCYKYLFSLACPLYKIEQKIGCYEVLVAYSSLF